jgi:hypothetical protein
LAGRPTPADFRRLVEQLLADPRFRRDMLRLVDCSQLEPIEEEDILFDEMAPLAQLDWEYPPRAVAIVAPGPMFERAVLARAHLGGTLVNRQVFADRDEALAWLRERPRSDTP